MSSFECEKCGAICEGTPTGYVAGCAHYPPGRNRLSTPEADQFQRHVIRAAVAQLAERRHSTSEVAGSTPARRSTAAPRTAHKAPGTGQVVS